MSDQDFFFDDDVVEEKPKEKSAKKPSQVKAKPKNANTSSLVERGSSEGVTITVTICALVAVIALLVGLIGGILIGYKLTPSPAPAASNQGGSGGGGMGGMGSGGGNAPVLSEEQIQQGMPEGHVPVDSTGSGDSTDGATDTGAGAGADDAINP
jgi:hypothetical protein